MKKHDLIVNKFIRGFLILGLLIITSCTAVSPSTTCIGWEFNADGDSEGWYIGQGITLEILDGNLAGDITQSSLHWIGYDNLNIDGSVYKTLEIKYRINSSEINDITYFYWINASDSQTGNDKRIKFDVQTDNQWQIANVNLMPNVNWNGVITNVRLYPAWFSDVGASVEYDYIRLCP